MLNVRFALLFLILLTTGCEKASSHAKRSMATAPETRVLVIVNDNSIASRTIGAFYAAKRHIPPAYLCHVRCPEQEQVEEDVFMQSILTPVAEALAQAPLAQTVDYLVLTKGIPLRIHSEMLGSDPRFSPNGDSVDGRLMTQDLPDLSSPSENPYFDSQLRFSHKVFGLYLVTRLDGYTVQDAEALVTRSLAAQSPSGTFLLDGAPSRSSGGDPTKLNEGLNEAAARLRTRHLRVLLDQSDSFVGQIRDLMGYWSWGSNDPQFNLGLYKGNTWQPGAIAETSVSTSARTMLPTDRGQSLIADLIATGATGAKGYVSEPYTLAIARPEILFDRYTQGWNLAEAFYCASPKVHWKDLVLGRSPLRALRRSRVQA